MHSFSRRGNEVCPHCRAEHTHVLGSCSVCGRMVCDVCGNVQFSDGKRTVVHQECLKDHGDEGFKMIKFVR